MLLNPLPVSPNPIWVTQTCTICDYSIQIVEYWSLLCEGQFQFISLSNTHLKYIIHYFLNILTMLWREEMKLPR